MVVVRWYLRYGLSYRDVEKLLAERCIAVDHGLLKARLRPMRGLKRLRSASGGVRRTRSRHLTRQYVEKSRLPPVYATDPTHLPDSRLHSGQ